MCSLYPGGGGVLGISCDRDDGRIFLGLKFSIPGFFWVRKFGKYFFGILIGVGIFWGYQKESVVPWLRSSANKVQTNVFRCCYCPCLIVNYGVALHRTCSAWDLFGVNFWSRAFFGFCWKP